MADHNRSYADFEIDDILEEARRKKLERLKQRPFSPLGVEDSSAVDTNTTTKKVEKAPNQSVSKIAHDSDEMSTVKKVTAAESATRSFRIETEIDTKVESSSSDTNNDLEVKIYKPAAAMENIQSTTPNLPDESVLNNLSPLNALQEKDDLDQIQLESLLQDLPEEYTATQSDDWEEQLQRERRKKAENFKLHPPATLRLSGEEEDNDPSEELDNFEDEEIEDYCSYEETDAVRSELIYRRRTGWLQLILTGAFSLTLIVSAVVYYLKWSNINPVLYIGLNVFLLAVTSLINHRSFEEGISALFHMRGNMDSVTSVLVLLATIHTIVQFLNPDVITGGKVILFAPVAAIACFLGSLGRQMLIIRITDNFQFVSYRGDKYAAHIIENRRMASEIGRAAVAIGDPVVCYLEKTDFITRFLENSYQTDTCEGSLRVYVPCTVGASAVLAVVFSLLGGSIMDALTVFVSAVCISMPAGALTTVNFPILRAARRVLRHGAMMIGWQAAEDFGDIHALAVDALEVFPSESVLLHGIKTFLGTRIDEAILDAAAVSIAAGGPLSSVFRRVIQNRTDILKEVDTLVYEQGMGMSGWVGGRRVLIGNRHLLENHGVDVPSRDYEARYTKNNRQIVYLSTVGELSAMFVISYVADAGITKALKNMCNSGITLLVRTCDPNVTEELICQVYDLDSFYVEVMGAPAGRSYEQLIQQKSEENDAVLASNGRLEGTAFGITYCRRLLKSVRLAMVVQIVAGILGLSVAVLLALYTGVMITPILLIAYTLLWTVVSWVVPCIYRV